MDKSSGCLSTDLFVSYSKDFEIFVQLLKFKEMCADEMAMHHAKVNIWHVGAYEMLKGLNLNCYEIKDQRFLLKIE